MTAENPRPAPSRAEARLVLGAPGTGKTEELIARALAHVGEGRPAGEILMLAPSRLAADRLREGFSAALSATISTPPARAWHSYAFDVLRRAHAASLLPGLRFEPRLLAGPEQDVLIGEMLEAHAAGLGSVPAWPEDLGDALGTRSFRREIREFLDRCAEFDLGAGQVRELGERAGRPEWIAAADFRVEYEQLRRLRMPQAYDPSALIHEAADFLEATPEFVEAEHERLRLVLLDDAQEATPAVLRLLSALLPAGSANPPELVVAACTDTVVQGFRGARPEQLSDLGAALGAYPRVETEALTVQHRLPPALGEAFGRVAERIPVVARARHERRPAPSPEAAERPADLEVALVASGQQELRLISERLLQEHVRGGRSLADMAVIVRDGASLSRIKRHLESDGIAVNIPVAETPLREEPAVRPFLDALWIASEPGADAGIERATSLLTSRLGGASPSRVRRLRQSLRAAELRAGGRRGSDELILAALAPEPGEPSAADRRSVRGPGTESLRRVRRVLAAGATALEEPGSTAETVLWALWESSGLAEEWGRLSAAGGPAGERADRDLDAMVELFAAAERYVDQQPGAGAREFLEYLDSQDLPMDTLAPAAAARSSVTLATPASAAGREWGWVHVASVQQGSWPNTTLRGGLLATTELSDAVTLGWERAASVTHRTRLRETRYDELRTFATAVSRSRERLLVSAVSNAEEEPSEFLDVLAPEQLDGAGLTEVRRPMTLRGLVAELRLAAQDSARPERARAAARCLARMGTERTGEGDAARPGPVPGAAPGDWWGLAPLTDDAAVLPAGEPVPVSPSRLETISRSPLDWFVAASGGEAATDLSRSVGTLIHEIAQDMPEAAGHELLAELEERFSRLGLPETWETAQTYERARTMLRKFAAYAVDARQALGRRLVGVEGSFSVLVPGPARATLLSGRVDRLEVDDAGRYVVIDLKTGKSAPTKAEVAQHPQLAAYQVALAAGAGEAMAQEAEAAGSAAASPDMAGAPIASAEPAEPVELAGARLTELSGGAALVQLGTAVKSYSAQTQPALGEEDSWAVELVQRCAELIAHERFQARHDAERSGGYGIPCRLPDICPICARGRQVTQP
ncbi:ATP-dependent helicase [Rothia halotolerans]|uniref:ATP-dependent helicase n=1 Tax=Rothia halotolerans TaxID=405770 RepID=UPI00101D3E5A|nr:ATP-dependent DNA helicase [Rothia halotolerans]